MNALVIASNFKTEKELQGAKVLDAESYIKKVCDMHDGVEIVTCYDYVINVNENGSDITVIEVEKKRMVCCRLAEVVRDEGRRELCESLTASLFQTI